MLRLDDAAEQLEDMEQQLMGYKDTMKVLSLLSRVFIWSLIVVVVICRLSGCGQVMNTALQEIEETNLAMSLQSRNQQLIMDELTNVLVRQTCVVSLWFLLFLSCCSVFLLTCNVLSCCPSVCLRITSARSR